MVETLEAPVAEYETLDEILQVVQRLSAHDKLVLIRILADELIKASNPLYIPPGVYSSFTPYDISGTNVSLREQLEAAPPPPTTISHEI